MMPTSNPTGHRVAPGLDLRLQPPPEFLPNHPLAPLTTLGVGGRADWFVEARTEAAVVSALAAARSAGLPVTVLGGGSNVLVSDAGVRGLVLRVRGGSARRMDAGAVRVDAGMTVNALVRWTIQRGLGGLESWAGTPGAVGGAIHGNAHFGGREIGERVSGLRAVDSAGNVIERDAAALDFGPGGRALRNGALRAGMPAGGELVLISADFRVHSSDPAVLRQRARASLAFRKRTQPLGVPSAGCAFRNPDPASASLPPDLPCAAGALLDRAGLKGASVGGARVSEVHANFLTAAAGTRARDVHRLIGVCREAVAAAFGVELVPELMLLGDFPS